MPKLNRYTAKQIATILKEIDHLRTQGKTTEESVEASGISMQTYYRWRERYGWMNERDATQLQELKTENARLKRLLEMWISQIQA